MKQNHEPEGIEEMGAFFDLRAEGYDDHMRLEVFTETTFAQFYQAVSAPIRETGEPIKILDLGCGTGLELEALFRRAPNAQVTGVDLSGNMLALLRSGYRPYMNQVSLVLGSYLSMPLETRIYDYIIAVMSLHHLLPGAKRALYKKIHRALKPGGVYIEGDSVTRPDTEAQFIAAYKQQVNGLPQAGDGHYHIDLPFSIKTQERLLLEAGFEGFELLWQMDEGAVWNAAVYAAST